MSLYEVERLIDRIEDHLKPDANLALISQDALEYKGLVDSVNLRIDQILSMYQAPDPDPYQAMQLSEAEPPLMEVITMLSFKDLPAWRNLVEAQNREKLPEIKRRALPILNDLFAENIGNLGEYWDEFNGFMIKEDAAGALNIIHQILKIAPDDQNAKDNLEGLERLDFKRRFERLAEALQVNNRNAILNELGGIWPLMKRFHPNAAQNLVWLNAKSVEVDVWLGQLSVHTSKGQWQEAVRYYREINKSITKNRLQLPPEIQQKLEQAGEWAEGQEADSNEQIEFKQHYDLLQDWLGQARLPNREAELLDEKTCREELDRLSAAWDKCHQFSDRLVGQIDQGVANHFRQRTLELQAQVEQYVRWRRVKIGAACSLFVIVLTIIFFRTNKSRGERDFVQQIKTEMAATNVLATSNLVVKGELDYPNPPGNVSKAISDGRAFITQEETKYKTLETTVTQLEQQTNTLGVATGDRFVSELQKANNSITKIAPDIKGPLFLRMARINNVWEDFKSTFTQNADVNMANEIGIIQEKIRDNFWRDEPDLEGLKTVIMDLEQQLNELGQHKNHDWFQGSINPAVLAGYDEVVRKVKDRKSDLAKHNNLLEDLKNINTVDDYQRILGELKSADLLPKDEKTSLDLALTEFGDEYSDKILRLLVFRGDLSHFKAIQERGKEMFPIDMIPPFLMTNLLYTSTHPLIHGLKGLPKATFILAVKPEQFSPFYITKHDEKWWEVESNGRRGNFGADNVQRRWTLNLVDMHFKSPEPIEYNEKFEKGANGLDKKWKINVGDNWQFIGSPVEYMSNICGAITMEKMEPMIGAWKLKWFFENLFPKQQGNYRPAVGDSLWHYGMPKRFALAFDHDLVKKTKNGKELLLPTWMRYHPNSPHVTESQENYIKIKEEINKFAVKYKPSFDQLTALRLAYNEITESGFDFVGFNHPTHGVTLLDRVKGKHIIGLSPAGEWVIKGKDNDELSPFSPLFVLRSDYGQDTRRLPPISETWHNYPPILTY